MTMEGTTTRRPPADWREQRELLSQLVWGRVTGLQEKYCPRQLPEAKAALAQLRRAASADAAWTGVNPDALAVDKFTHVPIELYPLTSKGNERRLGDEPTEAEVAVRSAMTLYAIHQQSRLEPMHGTASPGAALARLAWRDNVSEDSVRRRFAALVTAENYRELNHHLRTMTRMLRDQNIAVNYGQLTADLFSWQYHNRRSGVRLHWSRAFENDIVPRKSDSRGDDNS